MNIEDIAFKNFYKIIKPYLLSRDHTVITKFNNANVSGYNKLESGFYFFGYIDNYLDNKEIELLKANIKAQLFSLFGIDGSELTVIEGDPMIYTWGRNEDMALELSFANDYSGAKFISVTFVINQEIVNLFEQIDKNVREK